MRIALTGLRAAETQVSARSRNIVNVNTPGYRPVEPVLRATDAGVRAVIRERTVSPAPATLQGDAGFPSVSLAEEMIQMRLAEHAYKASAKVVAIASRKSRETIEILG